MEKHEVSGKVQNWIIPTDETMTRTPAQVEGISCKK